MSVNKLGIMVFSGFMALAMAPVAPAQSTAQTPTQRQSTPDSTQSRSTTRDTSQKQSTTGSKGTEKSHATGANSSATQDTQSTATGHNRSQVTDKNAETKENQPGAQHSTKEGSVNSKATGKSSQSSSMQRSSKEDVRRTQKALKAAGFDPGPIDGVMGAMTMTALRNYQSHNHLEVTGTITPETESSLTGSASLGGSRTPENTQTQPNSLGRSTESDQQNVPQSLGRSSDTVSDRADVREVQQALSAMQYNPGEANGMMTAQTQQAIREFQWLNGLPVTGKLDTETRSAIMSQGHSSSFGTGQGPANRELQKPAEPQDSGRTPEAAPENDKDYHHPNGPSAEQKSKSSTKDADLKPNKDASERVAKSVAVLQDLTGTPDKKIPNELLERAEAIAVVPNVIKGAFGIGGRYGKGVVSQRTANGSWSAPSFIEIGGGSFGAQLGVTSTDLVLVFTDRKALSLLDGGKDLKLGVDAGVAAGPVGRSAEAGVNANLDTAIYAYSRSKGLFAGVALDGAVLSIDKDMNEKVYGSSMDAEKILSGGTAVNPTVQPFVAALEKNVPRKRVSQK